MRSALITEHETLEDAVKEINNLLDAQPDAQIVNILPFEIKTFFGSVETYYKLITIRNFNGFSD